MRILVNYQHRDGWHVHCLADDAKTPISPHVTVRGYDTLLRLLRYVGATDDTIAEVKRDAARWGRGSVWIELAPHGENLLKIRYP